MISLKKALITLSCLLNLAALQSEAVQLPKMQALRELHKPAKPRSWFDEYTFFQNRFLVTGLGVAAAAFSYLGYAVYLNNDIKNNDSLWLWATNHLKDGVIDTLDLQELVHSKYGHLEEIHPLTAVFALTHALELEVQKCLTVRSMFNTLTNLQLGWLVTGEIVTLDKKLENLYLLKIALLNHSAETRNRHKEKMLTA